MNHQIPQRVHDAAQAHPYPLLFATISGAHLYGFPSKDSDWDLRGSHILPAEEILGLEKRQETITVDRKDGDFELDLVTHDAEKFLRLLLRTNGYVLEQLYSPLVVKGGEALEELRTLARGCITRNHMHHYLGFARNQWSAFEQESPPRAKPLLYVYRVLLTGIHLMEKGTMEAHIERLVEAYPIEGLGELISMKVEGDEQTLLPATALTVHESTVRRLTARLEEAGRTSKLPDAPTSRAALSDFLVRLRLAGVD